MSWLTEILGNSFYEVALILTLAALLGIFGQLLKQPLIVMFIALGVLVGPSVLDIVKSHDKIHLLAEIGIAILLFIVGLKLDLRIIKSVGKVALLTGLGQVIFTSLFGFLIGLALGFPTLHSFYIAVALTFSSTIIIVKLLSDKKEIDSLHGQIAVGFLIVQDIVVILVMIVLSAMQSGGENSLSNDIFNTLIAGLALFGFTFIAMKWILPLIINIVASSQELLVLFAISWALLLASAGGIMGFSGEVGAFLAGMSLASSDFKEAISSRLVSLRDFLLLFFFVNLGANIDLTIIGSQINSALIYSVFVLLGNPLIVLIIMGILGYRKRTSFLAGLTVAQISEFSLIFAGLGYAVGHITDEVVGLITLVGLVTIGLSTYLILYSHQIFKVLSPALNIFQRSKDYSEVENTFEENKNYDVIIIGLGRFGKRLSEMLERHSDISSLGVDFDPGVINEWKEKGRAIIYGDMEDPDILEQIPFNKKGVIVNTVINHDLSQQLVKILKKHEYHGQIFVTANSKSDYLALRKIGYSDESILRPHQMAASEFYQSCLKH